jgi:hypothetical protein
MSRAISGDVIVVPPQNNVYTALAGAAVLIQVIGLIVIFIAANKVGGLFH